MRAITADLTAVQRVRSPRARVAVTVEARGQNPVAPAVAWGKLVSNAGQATFWPTTAVSTSTGTILNLLGRITDIRKYAISTPSSTSSWTGASYVTVAATTVLAMCAVRVPSSQTIRLFYINSSNNVVYQESTNDGSTWGAVQTVYSGGNAVLDLVVAYRNDGIVSNGPWFVGFTTLTVGVYSPRFANFTGGAWVTTAYGTTNYHAGGIDAYGATGTSHRCLVFKASDVGQTLLRSVNKLAAVFSNDVRSWIARRGDCLG